MRYEAIEIVYISCQICTSGLILKPYECMPDKTNRSYHCPACQCDLTADAKEAVHASQKFNAAITDLKNTHG